MALFLAIWFGWPSQWGGNTTYVVVQGTSMQPGYHTGDVVIARASDDIDVGDVVVYAVPDDSTGAGKLIMHRVKSIEPDGRFVIQGDNRDTPDQFDIYAKNIVGVERVHIPKVGTTANLLGRWWFLAGLVALFALTQLWPDDDDTDDEDDDKDDNGDGDDVTTEHADQESELVAIEAAERERAELDAIWAATTVALPATTASSSMLAPPSPNATPVVALPPPAPMAPPRPVRPPVRPRRAMVIVDGDGLARSRWGQLPPLDGRQRAMHAADEIGMRFGTSVAMVFEDLGDDLDDRHHAHVVWVPEDQSLVDAIGEQLSDRPGGTAVMVVTDADAVAELAWAHAANVTRCSAWLALGASVGATIPG